MPIITISLAKDQTSRSQKRELIERFTAAATEITDNPPQAFTVLIQELGADSIGVGGKTLQELHNLD